MPRSQCLPPVCKRFLAAPAVGALASIVAVAPASAALWPFGGKPPATKPAATPVQTPSAPAALPASSARPAPIAAPTPGAAPSASSAAPYRVKGFRSAQFGMTREQVLAAIATDFKLPAAKVQTVANPQDRTTVMTVTVDALEPGPGPATVSYVLGAASRSLMRIVVSWVTPGEATKAQRMTLADDAAVLLDYFRGQGWAKGKTGAGAVLGPNALAMFVGQDSEGAAVEVDLQGVEYSRQENGKSIPSPPAAGPAALIVTYAQNADHPDVFRLPPGAF